MDIDMRLLRYGLLREGNGQNKLDKKYKAVTGIGYLNAEYMYDKEPIPFEERAYPPHETHFGGQRVVQRVLRL